MTKLILKIGLINIGLFIGLIIVATLVAFGMGYGSKSTYNKQLLILYSFTALIQIGINYLIYKKQIALDWSVLAIIVLIVVIIYVIYPLMIQ